MILTNKAHVKVYGPPVCDFKLYRKHKVLQQIFVQVLRRVLILNKQRNGMIANLKKVIEDAKARKKAYEDQNLQPITTNSLESKIFMRLQNTDMYPDMEELGYSLSYYKKDV